MGFCNQYEGRTKHEGPSNFILPVRFLFPSFHFEFPFCLIDPFLGNIFLFWQVGFPYKECELSQQFDRYVIRHLD